MNFRDYYLWAGMILLCLSLYYCSLLFTAPQFLRHGRRRKYLPNPDVRVTMQADKDTKNAPRLRAGSVLTTGRTTDGGVAHGDQSSKEWRKERKTERKAPQIIRNYAKKFYMPFRIHMDAHHSSLFPRDLAVRFPGLSPQNRISQKSIFRNFFD